MAVPHDVKDHPQGPQWRTPGGRRDGQGGQEQGDDQKEVSVARPSVVQQSPTHWADEQSCTPSWQYARYLLVVTTNTIL